MQLRKNWHQRSEDKLSPSDRIALAITGFAGTLRFIYIHIVWWILWFVVNSRLTHLTFDKYPYNLLTMILSLEAILLGTLIMIGQNLQAARDKMQAEHQFEHQELELQENTRITKDIHDLSQSIHKLITDANKKKVS